MICNSVRNHKFKNDTMKKSSHQIKKSEIIPNVKKEQPTSHERQKMSIAYHTSNTIGASIQYKGLTLFTAEHPDNCKNTIEEIQNRVNKYDVLIETIQRAKDVMDRDGVLEKNAVTYDLFSQLLKQSEQK